MSQISVKALDIMKKRKLIAVKRNEQLCEPGDLAVLQVVKNGYFLIDSFNLRKVNPKGLSIDMIVPDS